MAAPQPDPAADVVPVPWAALLESFFTDRANTRRGLTSASRAAYTTDLVAWGRAILAQRIGPKAANALEAAAVLAAVHVPDLDERTLRSVYPLLREQGAASTTQRRVGTLRLFVHWLLLEGHLSGTDPMLRIEAPYRPERLPAGWEDDELARLAAVVRTEPGRRDVRRWPARDWAMFAVLSTTGVRASELCTLKARSIAREGGGETTLSVIGKGNKQRNVPLPPEAVTAVDEYLLELDALFPGYRDRQLFWLTNGRPMNRSALNYLVDKWIRLAGVPKQDGEATHGFRHTFAKGLIRAGVPAPTVQEFLGHADLKTTGIYVKATAAALRDASLLSPARHVLRDAAAARPDLGAPAGTSPGLAT